MRSSLLSWCYSLTLIGITCCSSLYGQTIDKEQKPSSSKTKEQKHKDIPRKAKYKDIVRASKALRASISVGVNISEFGDLLRKFATEIEMLPKPNGQTETELINLYQNALVIYKDGLIIWDRKNSSLNYSHIPYGYCSVFVEEIEENRGFGILVNKYNIQDLIRNENSRGDASAQSVMRFLNASVALQRLFSNASELTEKANKVVE